MPDASSYRPGRRRSVGAARPRSGWLAPLLLLLLAPGAAAQRSLVVESFDVGIEVAPDGSIEVDEAIRYGFRGSWNGVFREIPVVTRTGHGFDKRWYLEVLSVTGEDGSDLWYEDSRRHHYRRLKIRVPGASDASRTVRIRYRIPGALLHFEEHDELYWNVTGDESEVVIERATADVRLPEGATGLRANAFTGAFGSTARNAEWSRTERGFYFETTEALDFREGLTVVVGWDPGVVHRPGPLERAGIFLRWNWVLLLPLLSLGGMWLIWRRWGRDPKRRSVQPRYEPPEGMTPSEVGTLVDNKPHMRDVSGDLVDLAVKGYLRIEEVEKGGLAGLLSKTDYALVRLRPPESWSELPLPQLRLLQGVFGYRSGDSVKLSELTNTFYSDLEKIRTAIFGRLKEAGYYRRRPDRVRGFWVAGTATFAGTVVPLAVVLSLELSMSPIAAGAAAILFFVPILAFGWFMPARTVAGTRKLEEILGFEEFLDRVESDRFRRMITSPDLFERYLPYAMALGVEERWARAFDDLVTEPPTWYVGSNPGSFRPSHFTSDLGRMSTRASSVMQSQPRSAGGGSSGFSSGGGFSGGGGGGGSTGGW